MGQPNTPAAYEADLDRRTGPALRSIARQPYRMEAHFLWLGPCQSRRPPGNSLGVNPMAVRELRQRLTTAPPGLDHDPCIGLLPVPSPGHLCDFRPPRHRLLPSGPSPGTRSIPQIGEPENMGGADGYPDPRLSRRRSCVPSIAQ